MCLRLWHIVQLCVKNQNIDSGSEILSLSQIVQRILTFAWQAPALSALGNVSLSDTMLLCQGDLYSHPHSSTPSTAERICAVSTLLYCFIRFYYGLLLLDHLQLLQNYPFSFNAWLPFYLCANCFAAWTWLLSHPIRLYFKFSTQKVNLLLSYFSLLFYTLKFYINSREEKISQEHIKTELTTKITLDDSLKNLR